MLTRKPHFEFLIGRQEDSSDSIGSSQDLASITHSQATVTTQHQHIPPSQQPLEEALSISARNSLEADSTSLLQEPSPLNFAPAMAAPPGGYS